MEQEMSGMGEMDNDTRTEFMSEFTAMFLEDCRQKVVDLEKLLDTIKKTGKSGESYREFMRLVHSLKGMAPTFNFPTVGLIAHHLEDYMTNIPVLSAKEVDEVLIYIDSIARIMDTGSNPFGDAEAHILRSLPTAVNIGDFSIEQKLIKTLFIGPKNVQYTIVEHELKSCGFSVTNSDNSFQAIEIAVRMKPDLIMVCNIIDILNGIEVTHILRSIHVTAHIPLVFVTSTIREDRNEREKLLARLPPTVEIIRKSHFPDDFADAMMILGII